VGSITMVKSQVGKNSHSYVFAGGDVATISERVALYMTEQGYRLESGDKTAGVYGKGSTAGMFFFGALSGRMKLNLAVGKDGDGVKVVCSRGMGGWWGGLIGAWRVRRKFETLAGSLPGAVLGG
jgi:hypothetical protein